MRSARAARLPDGVSVLLEPEVDVSVLLPEAPMLPVLPEAAGLLELLDDEGVLVLDEDEPLAPIVLGELEELDESEADGEVVLEPEAEGAVVLPDEPEAPIDWVLEAPAGLAVPLPPLVLPPEALLLALPPEAPDEPEAPVPWAMAKPPNARAAAAAIVVMVVLVALMSELLRLSAH